MSILTMKWAVTTKVGQASHSLNLNEIYKSRRIWLSNEWCYFKNNCSVMSELEFFIFITNAGEHFHLST